MKTVVYFTATNPPSRVDVRYFFNKLVAFDLQLAENDYRYFYDGELSEAINFLESIGFKDVRILDDRNYQDMENNFLLPRLPIEEIDFDSLNNSVDKNFLIKG